MKDRLIESIVKMREKEALSTVKEMLNEDIAVMDIMSSCREAMKKIGEKFENEEYFIPQLIMAAEIMEQITEITKEECEEVVQEEKIGTVLMGTVEGDIHDIGKGVVNFNLNVNGFEVIDLGEDVGPQKYIDAIEANNPDIVGMSCLLTVAFDSISKTIKEIEKAGYRDDIKIIIGGAPIDDDICDYVGADGWAEDAVKAVKLAKNMIRE